MAAADELARGLLLTSNPGINAQASVTFPAVAGISWVLTAVTWNAYALGETLNQQATIEVIQNAVVIAQLDIAILVPNTNWQKDSGSWTGQFPGAVGLALQVAFSSGLSGGSELLTASACPI